MKNKLKRTTLIIFLILSCSVWATNSGQDAYLQHQEQLFKMAGYAQAIEALPRSCKYVTTDMYTAASGGAMYIKGELITTYNIFDGISSQARNDKLLSVEAQKKALIKQRNSMLFYINILGKQRDLAISMKNNLNLAKSYTLNRFYKQKQLLEECLSDLSSSASKARSNILCGNGCAKTISNSRERLIQREEKDFTAWPSIDHEQASQDIRTSIKSNISSSCAKIGCVSALNGSSRSCDTYQNQYFINLVYCNPQNIATAYLPANILYQLFSYALPTAKAEYDTSSKAKIKEYRKEAAKYLDDWIAHPRGRALIYGTYIQYIDITINSIDSMIELLQKQAEDIAKMLEDLNLKVEEIKKDDEKILNQELKIPKGDHDDCYFQQCMSYQQMWNLRGKDYAALGDDAIKLGTLATEINVGLKAKRLGKDTMKKIETYKKYEKPLSKNAKQWEKKVDELLLQRDSVPAISIEQQEKSLFGKMFKSVKDFFTGSNKKKKNSNSSKYTTPQNIKGNPLNLSKNNSKKQSSPDSTQEEKVEDIANGTQYVIPTIHGKGNSIWQIISYRYKQSFWKDALPLEQ